MWAYDDLLEWSLERGENLRLDVANIPDDPAAYLYIPD